MTKLLPKSHTKFADKKYWDDFFSKRGTSAFEWYGEFVELQGILQKYIQPKDGLLTVGCGNSSLSADLYDVGCHDNTSIDISPIVIRQMTKKYVSTRPGMVFSQMDVRKMEFDDEKFNVVLDKGTLDALMPDETENTVNKVAAFFGEVGRVLKFGGRYLCISLLQEHILGALLRWCHDRSWMLRIHRCRDAEEAARTRNQSSTFPVFVVVCIKMKKVPGLTTVLEYVDHSLSPSTTRLTNSQDLVELVSSAQQYALLCYRLNTRKCEGEEIVVDFHQSSGNPEPRYRVYVVDRRKASPTSFAIFIVPQGRETDWIFSTREGRSVLADSAKSQRLLVVHLRRNHDYESLDRVKSELSEKVLEFAPPRFDVRHQKVPFLSLGDDVGHRKVLHRGCSPLTGDYVVEDVVGESGEFFRRLVFLSNPNVIQSEARLIASSAAEKSEEDAQMRVDHSYLACEHHKCMALGAAFVQLPPGAVGVEALLVGLGGGGLPSYVQHYLPDVRLDVVEIDSEVVSIAREWFDLDASGGKSLVIHIGDGLDYIRNAASADKHFDVIMLDVDNKDASSGLSVPPPAFLRKDILYCIKRLISPNGSFVLNLVCRDSVLKNNIYSVLREIFPKVCSKKIPEEVNEIVYAWSRIEVEPRCGAFPDSFLEQFEIRHLEDYLKSLEIITDLGS